MNPLQHFGIRSQFIRGDTKSYNKKQKMSYDEKMRLKYGDADEKLARMERSLGYEDEDIYSEVKK